MKFGLMLPQIRDSAGAAVEVAREAELARFDGLFVFDHKFPPGRPHDPVLEPFSLLTQVASETQVIRLGTFIARVDLKSIDELVGSFVALRDVAGERVIAGLGFGDRVTAEEDQFYGIPRRSFEERLDLMDQACAALHNERFPLWIGASSPEATEIAHRRNAMTALWQKSPRAEHVENYGWGGIFDSTSESAAGELLQIKNDGAQWAVCGYRGGVQVGGSFETLMKARHLVQ